VHAHLRDHPASLVVVLVQAAVRLAREADGARAVEQLVADLQKVS
jgi:hypothetical protein